MFSFSHQRTFTWRNLSQSDVAPSCLCKFWSFASLAPASRKLRNYVKLALWRYTAPVLVLDYALLVRSYPLLPDCVLSVMDRALARHNKKAADLIGRRDD